MGYAYIFYSVCLRVSSEDHGHSIGLIKRSDLVMFDFSLVLHKPG